MTYDEVHSLIEKILNRLVVEKGLSPVALRDSSRFLDGELPIDSLDLAVIVTELEGATGRDPFKDGFKDFRTVRELAQLYVD